MQTTKIFLMAALALMTAACSNDDNDVQTPAEQPAKAEGIPFTATISIGESASTRALTENGTTIEATWATGEKVALIYKVSATTYLKEAEVTPQGDGTATISTTLEGSPVDDTDVTIVYPYSAVDESTKDVKTGLLDLQNGLLTGTGSIAENYELRKTTTPAKLKIVGTTASLKGTVSLTNLNAIFKFTLQDLSAAPKSATEFKVSDNSGSVITTVKPGSASDVLYVALPAMGDGTYWFNATIDSKPYIAKANISTATVAGKYYQTTVKMATIGDVILANGKFAVAGTDGARAKICYLGSETAEADNGFNHGLALALSDANGGGGCLWSTSTGNVHTYNAEHSSSFASESGLQYNAKHNSEIDQYPAFQAAIANNGTAAPTGCSSWFLASGYQWKQMIGATGLNNLGLTGNAYYWSSTERDAGSAWIISTLDGGDWGSIAKADDSVLSLTRVRACLAF